MSATVRSSFHGSIVELSQLNFAKQDANASVPDENHHSKLIDLL